MKRNKKQISLLYLNMLKNKVSSIKKGRNQSDSDEICVKGAKRPNQWETKDNLNYLNFKFTSKELDQETGLYYFGARYLDPQISRFMSSDPIMEGISSGTSLYGYARNNPIRYTDPTGMLTKDGTIEWGDTLSQIAKDKGTTVDDIMKANPYIKDKNKIYAGKHLDLPGNDNEAPSENSDNNNSGGGGRSGRKISPEIQDDLTKFGKVTYQSKVESLLYESLAARLTRTESIGTTLGEGNISAVFSNDQLDEIKTEVFLGNKNFKYVGTSKGKLYLSWKIDQTNYYFGFRNKSLYWGSKFTGSNGIFLSNSFTFTVKPEPIIITVLIVAGAYYFFTTGDTSTLQQVGAYVH